MLLKTVASIFVIGSCIGFGLSCSDQLPSAPIEEEMTPDLRQWSTPQIVEIGNESSHRYTDIQSVSLDIDDELVVAVNMSDDTALQPRKYALLLLRNRINTWKAEGVVHGNGLFNPARTVFDGVRTHIFWVNDTESIVTDPVDARSNQVTHCVWNGTNCIERRVIYTHHRPAFFIMNEAVIADGIIHVAFGMDGEIYEYTYNTNNKNYETNLVLQGASYPRLHVNNDTLYMAFVAGPRPPLEGANDLFVALKSTAFGRSGPELSMTLTRWLISRRIS